MAEWEKQLESYSLANIIVGRVGEETEQKVCKQIKLLWKKAKLWPKN
jgi:hypothetical protein